MSKIESLKDCCSFQEGYVNPSKQFPEYFGGPVKWLRASDLNGYFVYDTEKTLSRKGFESAGASAFLFKKDTLAISKSGTIGVLGILKNEMCGNRAVINIDVDKSKSDLYYVFYLLKYKHKEILSKSHGSIQKNLYVSALETIKLNHKDLLTQQKIASVLSALDSKIELNNRINAELEAMAKTLYDYWFVQFEFPAALSGVEGGGGYKTSGGKMVWNEDLKREIPEGWVTKHLKEIVKCNYDSITKDSSFNKISYLDTSSLTLNQISSLQNIDVSIKSLPSRAQRIVNKNDILYSTVRPNLRHFGIIKLPETNMVASTGFAQISSILPEVKNELIYLYLSSETIINRLDQIASSAVSAYPAISHKDILDLELAFPQDPKVIINICNLLEPMFEKISLIQKENQKLIELRDWLLPMLMNGQVRVGDEPK